VQPLYLAAERGRLPELKRVIVAYGNRIAMDETLEASLQQLFGARPAVAAGRRGAGALHTGARAVWPGRLRGVRGGSAKARRGAPASPGGESPVVERLPDVVRTFPLSVAAGWVMVPRNLRTGPCGNGRGAGASMRSANRASPHPLTRRGLHHEAHPGVAGDRTLRAG